MSKDYYKTLGVDKNADAREIKKAYRKLAHEHHPDKETGDEAKFKEINEAYQILSDDKKRQMYDQFGADAANGMGGGAGGPGGMNWEDIMRQAGGFGGAGGPGVEFDLGDIFGSMFGGAAGAGGRGGARRRQQQRGADIQMDVTVEFDEAAFGVKQEVELRHGVKCSKCSGNGAEPGTPINTCSTCNGAGVVEQVQRSVFGMVRTQGICGDCSGQGKIPETKCGECHGNGIEKVTETLEVSIPAGIDNGQTIRLEGKGEAGLNGAPSGDLYINVLVRDSEEFEREGYNIYSKVEVPFSIMTLGGKIEVPTLDGDVTLKIPSGTESGKVMRLKSKGVERLQGTGRGDHLVTVVVKVPSHPPRKYRKAIEALQDFEESN